MIYILSLIWTAYSTTVPDANGMVSTLKFYENDVLINDPIWPEFQRWDFETYYYQTEISSAITSNFKLVLETVDVTWGVEYRVGGAGTWTPHIAGFNLVSGLVAGSNILEIKTCTPYTYTFTIFVESADSLTNIVLTNPGAITCTPAVFNPATHDYDCTASPNASNNTRIVINPTFTGTATMQIVSENIRQTTPQSLTSGSNNDFPTFFAVSAENFLHIYIDNGGVETFYRFKLYQTPESWKPTQMNIQSTATPPLTQSDWELMPRFHPDVYSYTLLPQLPSSADTNLKWQFIVVDVKVMTIYTDSTFGDVTCDTNTFSPIFRIIDGWNTIDAEFEYTDNSGKQKYTFAMYKQSRVKYLANQRFFLNPLVATQGAQLASNSSAIPDNFEYSYDEALDDYTDIAAANPALTQVNEVVPFDKERDNITLEDIQYSTNTINSGLMILAEPQQTLATMQFQITGADWETDYLNSFKTMYPLQIGDNHMTLMIIAEDTTIQRTQTYNVRVLSPDTTILDPVISGKSMTPASYDHTTDYYSVVVDIDAVTWSIQSQPIDSNATIDIQSTMSIVTASTGTSLDATVTLDSTAYEGMSVTVKVTAESTNIIRDITYMIERKDTCGNGLRWGTQDECDDGNTKDYDGCTYCRIDPGWQCSGGSTAGPDECLEIPKVAVCGDGIIEVLEECDDGNQTDLDGCSSECRIEPNEVNCGDGVRLPPDEAPVGFHEQCDDGNYNSGDGCSDACLVEAGWWCTEHALLTNLFPRPDVCNRLQEQRTYSAAVINEESAEAVDITKIQKKSDQSDDDTEYWKLGQWQFGRSLVILTVIMAIICAITRCVAIVFGSNTLYKTGASGWTPNLLSGIAAYQILACLQSSNQSEIVSQILHEFHWSLFTTDSDHYRRLLSTTPLTGFSSGIEFFILGFLVIFVCIILTSIAYLILLRHIVAENVSYAIKYTLLYYFLIIAYIPVFRHSIQYINDDFENDDYENYQVYIIGLIVCILIIFPFFLAAWTWANWQKLGQPSKLNKLGVFYESLRYPDPHTQAKVVPGLDITRDQSPCPNIANEERQNQSYTLVDIQSRGDVAAKDNTTPYFGQKQNYMDDRQIAQQESSFASDRPLDVSGLQSNRSGSYSEDTPSATRNESPRLFNIYSLILLQRLGLVAILLTVSTEWRYFLCAAICLGMLVLLSIMRPWRFGPYLYLHLMINLSLCVIFVCLNWVEDISDYFIICFAFLIVFSVLATFIVEQVVFIRHLCAEQQETKAIPVPVISQAIEPEPTPVMSFSSPRPNSLQANTEQILTYEWR